MTRYNPAIHPGDVELLLSVMAGQRMTDLARDQGVSPTTIRAKVERAKSRLDWTPDMTEQQVRDRAASRSKTRHAAGPWKLRRVQDGASRCFVINTRVRSHVAIIHGRHSAEKEANARLLSLSPELLDALEQALEYVPAGPLYDRAHLLIERAYGREPLADEEETGLLDPWDRRLCFGPAVEREQ